MTVYTVEINRDNNSFSIVTVTLTMSDRYNILKENHI